MNIFLKVFKRVTAVKKYVAVTRTSHAPGLCDGETAKIPRDLDVVPVIPFWDSLAAVRWWGRGAAPQPLIRWSMLRGGPYPLRQMERVE